jgi:hypothetical protein
MLKHFELRVRLKQLAHQLNLRLERSPDPQALGWNIIDAKSGGALEFSDFAFALKGVAARLFQEADERRCDALAERAREIHEALPGGWWVGSDAPAPELRAAPRF